MSNLSALAEQNSDNIPHLYQNNIVLEITLPSPITELAPELRSFSHPFGDEWGKERLKEQINIIFDKISIFPSLKKDEKEAFINFYVETNFKPIWFNDKNEKKITNQKAVYLSKSIENSEENGLDRERLISLLPENKLSSTLTPEAEFRFSLAAFLYVRDARGGRIEPQKISRLLPKIITPSPYDLLKRISEPSTNTVDNIIESYHPQNAEYKSLKKLFNEIRNNKTNDEKYSLPFEEIVASIDSIYDFVSPTKNISKNEVNTKIYDKQALLIKDANKIHAKEKLIETVLANMERWRWLASFSEDKYIFVNIPAFELQFKDKGEVLYKTRVIVGKSQSQTPILSELIEYMIINPSWSVPQSIYKKEFLPNIEKDPEYAAKKGFQVVNQGKLTILRQPPGERNALGYIKFIFPNEHSVYLHDTPSRGLFAEKTRAFSHGCVRIEHPFQLAEMLFLEDKNGLKYTEARFKSLVGRGERTFFLTKKLPVHLAYFTINADNDGKFHHYKDIYGYDARIASALHISKSGK